MPRSQALKEAQKRYREKNLELHRRLARESMKRKYEREHHEDSTLRCVRKLFEKHTAK